ncbi:hypothetical protein Y032_0009g760 [Ancylostoma ceylanicum]|uniref:Uncharacterized protein n=1 Tax=Ancylostoma ceylanicum TaxID=53326 RepID=A0A016VL52_9BILA|nr:hypothetical protein Y032_0009g760 [Ancylostoma ceylanicum]
MRLVGWRWLAFVPSTAFVVRRSSHRRSLRGVIQRPTRIVRNSQCALSSYRQLASTKSHPALAAMPARPLLGYRQTLSLTTFFHSAAALFLRNVPRVIRRERDGGGLESGASEQPHGDRLED